ncbi:Cytochrome P450, E-class, group I [Trema orientale]|uniref:Cytochrome P450, E-class, group I n=1 Tax=Trema orientale TaxID=63057 RepID=A0A2P5C1W2_TREOI|nr:Cytochrome P450, E-class, group I [Trema orientale]
MIPFSPVYLVLTLLFPFLVILWRISKPKGLTSKFSPRTWKLPIIGNLHQLAGALRHYSLRDLAKKYGPIMQLQLGEVLAVVISSPEAARDVLQKHEIVFAQRPSTLVVELFRSIREEEVRNLIESVYASDGLPINLREMFSRAAFGRKCRGQEEFISSMKEIVKIISGFDVADLFPSVKFLGVLTGMKPTLQRLHKKFEKILDEIIGSETTATTLEWAMAELPRNPRVVEKAQAERTNFEFLPFGAGRRMCPGISSASATVELALVQLL